MPVLETYVAISNSPLMPGEVDPGDIEFVPFCRNACGEWAAQNSDELAIAELEVRENEECIEE